MADLSSLSTDELLALQARAKQDAPAAGKPLNEMTNDELLALRKQVATNPAGAIAADVAKSGAAGVGRGVIGIMGLPADARNLAASGAKWAFDKLGMTGASGALSALQEIGGEGASSKNIQKNVEKYTGDFHKPETVYGEYAHTIGEFAPGMALGSGSLAKRAAYNVLFPALGSETAGQATKGTAWEPWARAGGAVAGGAIPSLVARAVTPLPISPERRAMVDVLSKAGVQPTAGQVTGRKSLQYMESVFGDAPLGGGKGAAAAERAGDQFTNAVSKGFGGAGRVTPDKIDDAFRRIGGEMDDLAMRHAARADRPLLDSLKNTIDDYNSLVSAPNRVPAVDNYLSEVSNALVKNGGTLPGDVYQSLRSRIEKAARGIGYNTPGGVEAQEALRGIKNALDDAVERGIRASGSLTDLGAWQRVRKEYKNLLDVTRAASGAGEDAALGIVSPSKMRTALTRNEAGRRAYARGNGDLAELTRAGNAVLTPLPQSGTAPRLMAQGFIPSMALAGGAAATGNYGTAAALAGSAVAPGVAGRALMSDPVQAYLSNQLIANYGGGGSRDAVLSALLASPDARAPNIPGARNNAITGGGW